jgi:hypothetical protein
MPKRSVKSPPRKEQKKTKQSTIIGTGANQIKKLPEAPLFVLKDICMTDAIYDDGAPPEMKGMLLDYLVTQYDGIKNTFSIQYQNRMITEHGIQWKHQDGNCY